ncbi:MAG TPA: transaldolase [Natronosporangium sp.]|nr:transaldolase [Natronosporangium sp.]
MTDRLKELSDAGVAIWLDDLSRERLADGSLEKMRREQHLVGITTNPTIFAGAISSSDLYDGPLREFGVRGIGAEEAARMITTYDVRWACDVMRPVYEATQGVDGRVSIEVDPRLAYRTEATVAEAKALWWMVDRPNLFIKIPATEPGLPAITECVAAGLSVNVTLIFSLDRYQQVMEAYLAGLERAQQAGRDLSMIASVASFFVSRVDTEVDKRLAALDDPAAAALQGRAAIANARLAYQRYQQTFTGPRWEALAAAGARPQRPLWASTSVKNPSYRDTMYVEQLIAPGVVNTMPESTLRAYADHGETRGDTVTGAYEDAQQVLDELARLGVDYQDVVTTLEREGVEKFEASWLELLKTVENQLGVVTPTDADGEARSE